MCGTNTCGICQLLTHARLVLRLGAQTAERSSHSVSRVCLLSFSDSRHTRLHVLLLFVWPILGVGHVSHYSDHTEALHTAI